MSAFLLLPQSPHLALLLHLQSPQKSQLKLKLETVGLVLPCSGNRSGPAYSSKAFSQTFSSSLSPTTDKKVSALYIMPTNSPFHSARKTYTTGPIHTWYGSHKFIKGQTVQNKNIYGWWMWSRAHSTNNYNYYLTQNKKPHTFIFSLAVVSIINNNRSPVVVPNSLSTLTSGCGCTHKRSRI